MKVDENAKMGYLGVRGHPRSSESSEAFANCYTDGEMSVITTYLNDNAQNPLG